MATRKTTATLDATAAAPAPRAPRKRATKATAPQAPVIEVALSAEESEARLRDEIALHAYLLWQSGAPGDREAHWLAAEQSLRSA